MADSGVLLDTSALMALLKAEPGSAKVQAALAEAAISAVNLVELIEVASRHGVPRQRAAAWVGELGLTVLPFYPALAPHAAALLATHREDGLSLGDATCLATALHHRLPVLTADRLWSTLGLDLDIRVIR